MDERSWGWRAVRGIIAIALHALAQERQVTVDQLELGSLVCHLLGPGGSPVRSLAARVVGGDLAYGIGVDGLAVGLVGVEDPDPVLVQWLWLACSWPAPAAGEPLFGGLARGIGGDRRTPAVDICTGWALDTAIGALNAERGGLPRDTKVLVTGGEHTGRTGRVVSSAWHLDEERHTVRAGPAPGYEVHLDREPGEVPVVPVILTGHLRPHSG
ncbi:hypothetical protein [Kitasatospora sp. MAP5-34]|uniref:hypothetical protein n=1 Tax=Kitasatospora sp. MAP5-34 TaxID=3035102 RepID=UPI002473B584|nr:hypothetical protein [Kitasatospora sp. MAP5-34]